MNNNTSHKIGLLSGVGPLAGLDVLAKIYKNTAKMYGARVDNDYPELHLLNHGIADVGSDAALNNNFKNEIAAGVYELEGMGADIIGIACNTAHIYMDSIHTQKHTKIINLIDKVSYAASKKDVEYLLLTSYTSKQQKLYDGYLSKYDVSFHETSLGQQSLLDEVISCIMSHELDRAGALMDTFFESAAIQGYTSFIAGCTELPIAIKHAKNAGSHEIIDSNNILAEELVISYYA